MFKIRRELLDTMYGLPSCLHAVIQHKRTREHTVHWTCEQQDGRGLAILLSSMCGEVAAFVLRFPTGNVRTRSAVLLRISYAFKTASMSSSLATLNNVNRLTKLLSPSPAPACDDDDDDDSSLLLATCTCGIFRITCGREERSRRGCMIMIAHGPVGRWW